MAHLIKHLWERSFGLENAPVAANILWWCKKEYSGILSPVKKGGGNTDNPVNGGKRKGVDERVFVLIWSSGAGLDTEDKVTDSADVVVDGGGNKKLCGPWSRYIDSNVDNACKVVNTCFSNYATEVFLYMIYLK